MKKILSGLLAFSLATSAMADNVTTISRSLLDHPNLGHVGGAALHAHIAAIYQVLGDNANARFKQYTSVANSTLSTYRHNFGVAFAEMKVLIYTGSGNDLTRVSNPTASGWVIAANGTNPKLDIDVTTPGSGGPHTFVVVVIHGKGVERLDELDDVDLTVAPEDGQALVYDGAATQWKPGASGDSSLKIQSVAADGTTIIKGGFEKDGDGNEFATYDGSGTLNADFGKDTTIDLDNVLASPVNDTTYYLYIDKTLVAAAITTTDAPFRKLKPVVEGSLFLSTATPDSTTLARYRYVPLGLVHRATGAWSTTGFKTIASKVDPGSSILVNPVVYEATNTVTGFGGTTGTITHNKNVAINNQEWVAFVTLSTGGNSHQLDNDWITNKTVNAVSYDFTGLVGADSVKVVLRDISSTAATFRVPPYDSGELSAAPSFPIAHNQGTVPTWLVLRQEGVSESLKWDDLAFSDFCSVDATNISCDFGSPNQLPATIGASNRIRIIAGAGAPGGVIDIATATRSGVVSTGSQTFAGIKTFQDVTNLNAGFNIPLLRAKTSSQSIPDNSAATVIFTAEDYDTSSAYNTGTGVFTAPVTGKYRVSSYVRLTDGTFNGTTDHIWMLVNVNGAGTGPYLCDRVPFSGETRVTLHGTTTVSISSGQTLSISMLQNSAGALTINPTESVAGDKAWLTIDYVGQ